MTQQEQDKRMSDSERTQTEWIERAYCRFEAAITALQDVWRNGRTNPTISAAIDDLVPERDRLRRRLVELRGQ